jgi:hypothetical protein
MAKYNRYVIAAFSDTHGGHTLGLLNPETIIKEYDQQGREYNRKIVLGSSQTFLWELYTKHVKELEKIAGKDMIVAMHMGDLTQGQKYRDQLVYSDMHSQMAIGYHNMLPVVRLKNTKYLRLAWGTPSHVFQENTSPRMIWDKLLDNFPKKDIRGVPHGLLTVRDNIQIDYSHHGPPPGSRNWLVGNNMRRYLQSLQQDEIDCQQQPPDLVLRGHYHSRNEETVTKFANGTRYKTTGLLIPSYSLLGDHARQAVKSPPRVTNGMAVIEVIDNKIFDVHWLTKTSDSRVKEKIK